jgi:hypothetical protein
MATQMEWSVCRKCQKLEKYAKSNNGTTIDRNHAAHHALHMVMGFTTRERAEAYLKQVSK